MKFQLLILSVCAALLAASPTSAAPRRPAAFDPAWRAVTEAFHADMASEHVVGGSLAFAQDGQILAFDTWGAADLAGGRAVNRDTIYHWASITKPFTAVAILQLRDQGRLSLEDPAVKYVPELRLIHNSYGPVEQITIRTLLTHSSGLREDTWPWGGKPWQPYEPPGWAQLAAMMPYTETRFAPGSRYAYSNPGTTVLGRIVEVVTGEDFEAYAEKNILRPLGMDRSYYDYTPPHLLKDRSNNYNVDKAGVPQPNGLELDTGVTVANGGLNGPVDDLMTFASFLLGVGDAKAHARVLARSSVDEMLRPAFPTNDSDVGLQESIGLSLFIEDDVRNGAEKPVRYIGHTGSQRGFLAFIYVEPRTRTAIVAAWNTRPFQAPRKLVYATRRRAFDQLFPLFRR